MHYLWTKGQNRFLTKNFSTSEFDCPCHYPECVEQRINKDLVDNLQKIRDDLNDVITITSAYRCSRYHADLTGRGYKTVVNSQHILGNAADVTSRNMSTLGRLVHERFLAVGVARNFFHVDERRDKPRTWNY